MASLLLAIFMAAAVVVVLTAAVSVLLVLAVAEVVVAVVAALVQAALQFMAQLLGAGEQATVPAVVVLATAVTVQSVTVPMAGWAVLEYLAVVAVLATLVEGRVEMAQ